MIPNISQITRVGKCTNGTYISYERATAKDGWIDASLFLPMDYVLSEVKINGKVRVYKGWVNSKRWDGLNIQDYDVITHWKHSESPSRIDREYNKTKKFRKKRIPKIPKEEVPERKTA